MDLKSEFLEAFVKYVVPVLFTGIMTLVGIGFSKLAKKWGADGQTSKLAQVGSKFAHFGEMAAHDIEATIRKQLDVAAEDGDLSEADYKKMREVGVAKIKELAGTRGLAELKGVMGVGAGALDTYIGGVLEKAVASLPSNVTDSQAAVASTVAFSPFSYPGGLPLPPGR